MREQAVKARAKINLSLDVLGKMPDGYHEMRMVMQSVTLCDDISIRLNDTGRFTAVSNLPYLPRDERNIALKAARLFLEKIGDGKTGAEITIQKRVPVCAGLGGGSGDAAAVLLGMNALTGGALKSAELMELALPLGADVPFCLMGGTALAGGRGEVLTPLESLPDCELVIAKPAFSISTPELFSKLDCAAIKCRPDTGGLIAALHAGNLTEAARRCYNIFEDFLPRAFMEVHEIKGVLLDFGALGASMSGTGPSVFGIFPKGERAAAAAEYLARRVRDVFLCAPSGASVHCQ